MSTLLAQIDEQKEYVSTMAETAGKDHQRFAAAVAGLLAGLSTGSPALGALAHAGVSRAFANAADKVISGELEALSREEERSRLVLQVARTVEVLLGQILVQLISSHHRVKDELLDSVGGLRSELSSFRLEIAQELGSRRLIEIGEQLVEAGALGVRVSAGASRHVFVGVMRVSGSGSVGVDVV